MVDTSKYIPTGSSEHSEKLEESYSGKKYWLIIIYEVKKPSNLQLM